MKTWMSWSCGKDSAWALHQLRQNPDIELSGIFTTLNREFGRVAMHGIRRQLLEAQATALELPLAVIDLPWPCSNARYKKIMAAFIDRLLDQGAEAIGFGDLYLTDIRQYRVKQLAGSGIQPLFPLWNLPTAELAENMLAAGLKARISTVDPRQLDGRLAGREYDRQLLADLPSGVDPCGENGEFHTFVHAGPMFTQNLSIRTGDIVERNGFVFADLLPDDPDASY